MTAYRRDIAQLALDAAMGDPITIEFLPEDHGGSLTECHKRARLFVQNFSSIRNSEERKAQRLDAHSPGKFSDIDCAMRTLPDDAGYAVTLKRCPSPYTYADRFRVVVNGERQTLTAEDRARIAALNLDTLTIPRKVDFANVGKANDPNTIPLDVDPFAPVVDTRTAKD